MGASLVTFFDPAPHASELPDRFASPFSHGPAHPLARRAAETLLAQIRGGELAAGVDLEAPEGGKMFGVLVVATPEQRVGYLRAFSGMLGGRWHVDGFVPPLFDTAARDREWPAGEAELARLDLRIRALSEGGEATALRAELAELEARHATERAALEARHRSRRQLRHDARRFEGERLEEGARRTHLHGLEEESRADGRERRRVLETHRIEHEGVASRLRAIDEARRALEEHRATRSRYFFEQLLQGYVVPNARGELRPLRALFEPDVPPGGAGDCAAPKLLGHAYRLGLRPLALAEVWWGAPPLTGGRRPGVYYPACRGKCGKILPHMLEGLPVEPAPIFGAEPVAAEEPRVLYEDAWLTVVHKPCGLLSVPGRGERLFDSVLTRLRARHPEATGPIVVHRLDLDTSGLLLAAKDPQTYAALQRSFAARQIEKRYVAWLDGQVRGDRGSIALALRGDLDDRPRQIHDPVAGKSALTEWRVVTRTAARTKVALYPRTGRTHQLRVHAAHGLGLGAPIVGDRLYGRADERLMLHAEALAFVHPHTGALVELECPAPF